MIPLYLLLVLFRALHQAEEPPFSHTTTTPRGYSLHRAPTLVTVLLTCAEWVLTKMSYIWASPKCIVVPRWPGEKNKVALNHYLHHHSLVVTTLYTWYLSPSFLTHYSLGAFSFIMATLFPCLQSLHRWWVYHQNFIISHVLLHFSFIK